MVASFFQIVALFVVRGAEQWNILAIKPLPALALLCLQMQSRAYNVSLLCFAIFTAVIAYLVVRSKKERV
jgi:hypothetical protein